MGMGSSHSVVVTDLDLVRSSIAPPEADAPLVVDGNRVLAATVTPQAMKPVAPRHAQVSEGRRQMNVLELPRGADRYVRRESPRAAGQEQIAGPPVGE